PPASPHPSVALWSPTVPAVSALPSSAHAAHPIREPIPSLVPPPTTSPLFPYTTLFRSASRVVSRPAEEAVMSRKVSSSAPSASRSEEHTSELQSREKIVCRLLLEKKKGSDPPAVFH